MPENLTLCKKTFIFVLSITTKTSAMTTKEIKKVDADNLSATYEVGHITIKFDAKNWTWRAVNTFGFGTDSDDDIKKLLKRVINDTAK